MILSGGTSSIIGLECEQFNTIVENINVGVVNFFVVFMKMDRHTVQYRTCIDIQHLHQYIEYENIS